MRIIYTILILLHGLTATAQINTEESEFISFVGKLDVDYYCGPSESPSDDFMPYFLNEKGLASNHSFYRLKSKSLFRDIKGEKRQLVYFLSSYKFNETSECTEAINRFFSKERIEGLKYKVDGQAKTSPMVMIFNSRSIYCLYGNCDTEVEIWESLKKAFIDEYAKKEATILIAQCGNVKWITL
ncbi:MAG: hypothetical protein VZQ98_14485 [Bacteroidales bacterium]|nr:hypothetical protein [Bacteroidales bacterium]